MPDEKRKAVSSLEEFTQVLELLVSLYEKDAVRFNVWLPANVDLIIDRPVIEKLLTGKKIKLDRFQQILDQEISVAIAALMSDNKKLFINVYYPRYYSEGEEDEKGSSKSIITEATKKIELCEKQCDFLPMVEAQYLTKRKSKLDVLKRISWDTSTKELSKGDKTRKVELATLQFIFQRQPIELASAYRFYPFFPVFPTQEKSLSFDCHLNDILSLIEVLTKVAKNLSEKEREK